MKTKPTHTPGPWMNDGPIVFFKNASGLGESLAICERNSVKPYQDDEDRANARLGEIRGWELHIAAIYRALTDAPQPRTETEPSYPLSGTMPLEPKIPEKK